MCQGLALAVGGTAYARQPSVVGLSWAMMQAGRQVASLLAGLVVFGLGVVLGHGRLEWRWFGIGQLGLAHKDKNKIKIKIRK